MSRPTLSRAAPWRIGVVAVVVAGGMTLAGAGAVGALSGTSGGQPAPGSPNVPSDVRPGPNTQPPAGAPNVPSDAKPAGDTQPANLNPQRPGPSTQLKNDEPHAKPHPNQVDNGTAVSPAE